MARGSEQFAFRRHPGVPRECAYCHRPLKRDDVATVVEFPKPTRFYCREHMHEGYAA